MSIKAKTIKIGIINSSTGDHDQVNGGHGYSLPKKVSHQMSYTQKKVKKIFKAVILLRRGLALKHQKKGFYYHEEKIKYTENHDKHWSSGQWQGPSF